MSTNDSESLNQQRRRRKRINRIKSGIILTLAIWMITSLIAIIVLSVNVIQLNHRVGELEAYYVSQDSEADLEGDAAAGDNDSKLQGNTSVQNIVTGIDSPDNLAEQGDVHQVYLTFDSGPDENTNAILDVLEEYQVKATFFVAGNESEEMIPIYQRIVNDGHTIGMHSFSNQYSTIYDSKAAFSNDMNQIRNYIANATGVTSMYYRFPGGSSNQISNVDMAEFVRILNQNKITYFDWNVSAGDAASDYSVDDVVNNVINGVQKYKTSVVLLHDGADKTTTVEAMKPLIEALQNMQAEILPIDENTKVIQYIKSDSVE